MNDAALFFVWMMLFIGFVVASDIRKESKNVGKN